MCKFIRHLNGDSLIAAKEDEYLSFYMQLDALTRKPPLTHLISLKREIMLPVYGPVIIPVTEAASNLTHIQWDCCAKNSCPLLPTAAEGTAADQTHRHLQHSWMSNSWLKQMYVAHVWKQCYSEQLKPVVGFLEHSSDFPRWEKQLPTWLLPHFKKW